MLAHAHASKLYSRKYRPSQGGKISITLNGDWAEPWDDIPESALGLRCRLSHLWSSPRVQCHETRGWTSAESAQATEQRNGRWQLR
jgi:hypothetical protein